MGTLEFFDKQIGELQAAKETYLQEIAVAKEEGKLEGDGAGYERGYKQGEIDGYNKGLAENENVPDGVFTEQEVANAKEEGKAEVRAELQPQIDSLGSQIAAMQVELDGLKAQGEADKVAMAEVVAKKDSLMAAIQVEIEDKKTDSSRLEAVVSGL
jgi:flagellar biosynthesis/type III secretory pathway protein FliH